MDLKELMSPYRVCTLKLQYIHVIAFLPTYYFLQDLLSEDKTNGPLNMTYTIDLVKDIIANYEKLAMSNDTIFKLMEAKPEKMDQIGKAIGSLLGTMTNMSQQDNME